MHHSSLLRLLSALLVCLGASATGWAATTGNEPVTQAPREAFGLIVGLKGDDAEESGGGSIHKGPWATERAREHSHWIGRSREGRERLHRLAKEAGLPDGTLGEAGNARLLRFKQPLRGASLDNAVRRARLHPDVAWVEPDVLVPRLALGLPRVPNDPLFLQQWHLHAADRATNFAGLNMAATWGDTTGSPVVVAVVDSGIRADHPDLQALGARLLPGYDLVSELAVANDGNGRDADPSDPGDWVSAQDAQDPLFAQCTVAHSSWHGTFIAGQIAAATDNLQGVAGVNWAAKVLPVRVSGKCGALLSDLLDGMRWAAGLSVSGLPNNPHPAKVINLSFGGDQPCSLAYQGTISAVTNKGALVVVAAGNADKALTRPADCRRVMAVGAVRQDGAKTAYSSFGGRVALAAPGGSPEAGLLSTDNDGTMGPGNPIYGLKQGTSFAAPLAAGVASLMLAVNPQLSPNQLITRMQAGARPFDNPIAGLPTCGAPGQGACNCTAATCGSGLLDADRAVQLATGPAVVIKAIADVEPGTVVTLDGSASVAIPGASVVSYQWAQVSGPAVTIASASGSVATATLVAEETYVFSLTVKDSVNRLGEDTVAVVAAMPEAIAASPVGGGGGGSVGQLWGMSLWAWVIAVLLTQRRRRQPV